MQGVDHAEVARGAASWEAVPSLGGAPHHLVQAQTHEPGRLERHPAQLCFVKSN